MTDLSSTPQRFAEHDFRVGHVVNEAASVLSRNFPVLFAVTVIADLPALLLGQGVGGEGADVGTGIAAALLFALLMLVFSMLSQAVIVHVTFQNMRGRPVQLGDALNVAMQRFLPILGVALLVALLAGLGMLALIVPGVILAMMWFVAIPVCVVEQRSVWASMQRSAELTKGHRWKIFGMMILLLIISGVVSSLIALVVAFGGSIIVFIVNLIWTAIWGAFFAVVVAVTYHDLRVAKEGIDIEQIAGVFD
jgi:hypothetical protein